MCGCNKNKGAARGGARRTVVPNNTVTRQSLDRARLVNNGTAQGARLLQAFQTPVSAATANERKRIEKLRKETLLRRFGKL